MKKSLKKILIKWIIVEAIISLFVLSLTPYLFGSIKPFKANKSAKTSYSNIKTGVAKAIKRPGAKKRVKSRKSRTKTRKGILRKIKRSFYMQGTHYLEVNGKRVALLKSKKINLNKYTGKKVAVYGKAKKSTESPKVLFINVSKIKLRK